jgi:hypothetical protein
MSSIKNASYWHMYLCHALQINCGCGDMEMKGGKEREHGMEGTGTIAKLMMMCILF